MVRYTFFQRLGHHDVCVVPARVLSAEPTHDEDPSSLQAEASHAGQCYVRVLLSFGDGTYLAHVAASPDFKCRFTVVFSEAQLPRHNPLTGVFRQPERSAVSARLLIGSPGAGK